MTARLSEQATRQTRVPVQASTPTSRKRSDYWFDFNQTLPAGQRLMLGSAGWIAFLLLWQVTSQMELAPDRLYPGPAAVFSSLKDLFLEQGFFSDVLSSVTRIAVSFTIAILIALPIGLLMGSFARVDGALNPLLGASGNRKRRRPQG